MTVPARYHTTPRGVIMKLKPQSRVQSLLLFGCCLHNKQCQLHGRASPGLALNTPGQRQLGPGEVAVAVKAGPGCHNIP